MSSQRQNFLPSKAQFTPRTWGQKGFQMADGYNVIADSKNRKNANQKHDFMNETM